MSEQSVGQQAQEHYASRFGEELRLLVDAVDERSDEEALQELEGMPLSFVKVSTHHVAEEIEWEILLSTGGPADRVLVVTDLDGNIESAEYQFQDWFTAWTPAPEQDAKLVRRFAEIVGYYEDLS